MIYYYEYVNNIKLKIWVDELPIQECQNIKFIKKKYKADTSTLNNMQLTIELQIPRNVNSYGMLGVKYQNNLSDAKVIINVSEYEEKLYRDNISIEPDIVHQGIPEEYVNGIINSVERNQNDLLKSGTYKFNVGAHGEIGSSEHFFEVLSNILLKLLNINNFNSDIIKEILNNEDI